LRGWNQTVAPGDRNRKGRFEMKARLLVLLATLVPIAALLGGQRWP
jgi:hypothetical protein